MTISLNWINHHYHFSNKPHSLFTFLLFYLFTFNSMSDEEFKALWEKNRKQILANDDEYQRIQNGYKQGSVVNWIIIIGGAVVGSSLPDFLPIESTVLKWVLAIVAGIIVIAVGLWIRSLFISPKTAEDVEHEVMERYRRSIGG